MRLSHAALVVAVLCAIQPLAHAQGDPTEQPDNYTWLEDVHGARSMDWVKTHDEASAKILDGDPRFPKLRAEALKVTESPDRIPVADLTRGEIYNSWQDANHVRGILRRTTLSDYLTAHPHWKTVIDYDALGKKEHKSWVDEGAVRLYPGDTLCLAGLSDGGEDALTYREFNLKEGRFVKNGFVIPKAKTDAAWLDRNHLVVSTDWGQGTLTESGYPYITKIWTRGTPLRSAREIFRGNRKDVGVGAAILHDGQGHQVDLIVRNVTFFDNEVLLWNGSRIVRPPIPPKVDVDGLLDNRLVLTLRQDWTPAGKTYASGSVLAIDMADIYRNPDQLRPTVIFAPTLIEFAQDVALTKNKLLLHTLKNVEGCAYVYSVSRWGSWTRKKLPVPNNLSVSFLATSNYDDKFFLDETGFITPESVYLGDAARGTLILAKSRKPQFDASNMRVDQLWATSKDGTRIPYFIVRKKDMRFNGDNPTLLTAYGGFQVSMTPYYSGTTGKLWLEKGGVYVLANIRGGGEFGPAWHEAGLKTHRQRIYDDFAAVGSDLVARKITCVRRLGIEGGSNGGLLMGVEFTQHPDMWNAVVIEVPLLDMLGFEHLAAGASWVGEYGSTSVPAERRFLASISPYNQLKRDVDYPEPLIFTTTKDDRVGPVHARKFAARMEEFGKPFFYDEITEGGHSAGADLVQEANTEATIFTYLMSKLMD